MLMMSLGRLVLFSHSGEMSYYCVQAGPSTSGMLRMPGQSVTRMNAGSVRGGSGAQAFQRSFL